MVIGATGVGKPNWPWPFAMLDWLKRPAGAIIDLSSRGDSQNHAGYGQRMFDRPLTTADPRRDELPIHSMRDALKMSCRSWATVVSACSAAKWMWTNGIPGNQS